MAGISELDADILSVLGGYVSVSFCIHSHVHDLTKGHNAIVLYCSFTRYVYLLYD